MGFNVAYCAKDKINNSTAQGIIPKQSLIITNGQEKDAEAYYYDENGKLKQIIKKTSFASLNEARLWIAKYDYAGEFISIYKDSEWRPYMVGADKKIYGVPFTNEVILVDDYVILDAGGAPLA